jgi:hypothetical protein
MLLKRYLHAAGSLSQIVGDTASPLALSQSLQVCLPSLVLCKPLPSVYMQACIRDCVLPCCWVQIAVQSFGVSTLALRALSAVTEALELDANQVRVVVSGCCAFQLRLTCNTSFVACQ